MLFKPLALITIALSAYQAQAAITALEMVNSLTAFAIQAGELQKAVDSLNANNVDTVGAGITHSLSLLQKPSKDLQDALAGYKDANFSENDQVLITNAFKAMTSAADSLATSLVDKRRSMGGNPQIESILDNVSGELLNLIHATLWGLYYPVVLPFNVLVSMIERILSYSIPGLN
ncbi:hypothetical protein PT974_00204 [Cladobotryum mycophilum]|uniref:Uncharacterized protein n=1 Tax=Cladobotryum mycophilum TaxID=491253 RepID=A0ABR0T062_9HYPO